MTTAQKVIKYLAMAFAVLLIVTIIGGIVSAVGLLGGFLTGDAVMDEVKTYAVSSCITSLDIEIGAADFIIKEADSFSVESNLKNLTVREKNGTLTIAEKSHFGSRYGGAMLTLYVPAETVFEKADIVTGAGKFTADALYADTLRLVLGAGEVSIGYLSATTAADIDGGAGKLTIAGGKLCHLDLDMGVGQLNLTSSVMGNSELDLGVGESNITLIGDEENYAIDIDKGIGSITVNGKSVSDYGSSGGENRIEINGGIGAIHLTFVKTLSIE